jgi:ABC-type branched-subunit amino acid transport system permease subunit
MTSLAHAVVFLWGAYCVGFAVVSIGHGVDAVCRALRNEQDREWRGDTKRELLWPLYLWRPW